jgi:hypothetical protein
MNIAAYSILGSLYVMASSAPAHAGCSPPLNTEIASVERVVASLRPDKPGQMRVTAADGSEFTAGQAQWMKGQLRGIDRSCAQGDEATAVATLRTLQGMLHAHNK